MFWKVPLTEIHLLYYCWEISYKLGVYGKFKYSLIYLKTSYIIQTRTICCLLSILVKEVAYEITMLCVCANPSSTPPESIFMNSGMNFMPMEATHQATHNPSQSQGHNAKLPYVC